MLWKFKLGLTQSDNFLKRIKKNCRHDLDAFQECDKLLHESPGLYMSCIVTAKQENPDSIGARCHQFLGRIETIIFSDYRLVGDFANKCQTGMLLDNFFTKFYTTSECGPGSSISCMHCIVYVHHIFLLYGAKISFFLVKL